MGIGQKIKGALAHNDDDSDRRDHESRAPGAFPADDNYKPPQGTHVGHQDDSSYEDTVTDHHHGSRFTEHNVNDRNLMDPADRKHQSNVMDTTGAAGDPVSRSSTDEGDRHNKLHKRNDPRRYDDRNTGTGRDTTSGLGRDTNTGFGRDTNTGLGRDTNTGLGGNYSSNTPTAQKQDFNRDNTRYDRDSSQLHDSSTFTSSHTPRDYQQNFDRDNVNRGQDLSQSYGDQSTSERSRIGQGVQDSITGTHHQGERDRRDNQSTVPSAYGTTERRDYKPSPFESGVGTRDGTYNPQSTTGSSIPRRNVPESTRDQRGMVGSGAAGSGLAGTMANEALPHRYGQQQRDTIGTDSNSRQYPSRNQDQESYNIQNPNRSSVTAPTGYNQAGSGDAFRSQARNQPVTGAAGGIGSGVGTNTGVGSNNYGSGHFRAKVVHQCQQCGHDNDISHYFGEQAVYRLG